ncbi:hypothetical protein COO60DRAFT_1598847, partial [Scenedesmus sp. NREL 46B-D3]
MRVEGLGFCMLLLQCCLLSRRIYLYLLVCAKCISQWALCMAAIAADSDNAVLDTKEFSEIAASIALRCSGMVAAAVKWRDV